MEGEQDIEYWTPFWSVTVCPLTLAQLANGQAADDGGPVDGEAAGVEIDELATKVDRVDELPTAALDLIPPTTPAELGCGVEKEG